MFNSETGLFQSEESVQINDKMPLNAFNFLKENFSRPLKDSKILLFGVSYLSNVGDTRFTPVELFYRLLKSEGAKIKLHDPYINYWNEMKINIGSDLDILLNDVYDIIVFTTAHDKYKSNKKIINKIINMNKTMIIDTIGILNKNEIRLLSESHKVKVIGRGDI